MSSLTIPQIRDALEMLEMLGPDHSLTKQIASRLGAYSLLGGDQLAAMVEQGVIDAPEEHINAASIDVRLGREFLFESNARPGTVDLSTKAEPAFERVTAGVGEPVYVQPGEFFLGHLVEQLALPDDVSCLFLLRSSCARAGLEHSQAGFGDAGFHGQLTLALKNILQHHRLALRPGMRIGQIVFLRHADAGERSYRLKGRYGGQTGVQPSKGVA